ncbi:MAG: chorismate-binding protein [Thermoplasmataceae archaeon]
MTCQVIIERENRIPADKVPVLFNAFNSKFPGTVLLETTTPGGNTILTWDPAATITVKNGLADVKADKDIQISSLGKDKNYFPEILENTIRECRTEPEPENSGLIPFIGGFIGYVGYEWAAKQQGFAKSRIQGIPDAWFSLYDRALVVDKNGSVYIIAVPSIRNAKFEYIRSQIYTALIGTDSLKFNSVKPVDLRFEYDFPREQFEEGVREVKSSIRSGDVYQANIAQRIRSRGLVPWQLYSRLREYNPSPYSGILSAGGFTIVSSSPERLISVVKERSGKTWVSTRPIAGTRPRGDGKQDLMNERALTTSRKELAEHTMLVDLSRNDLGRVSLSGSVMVDEFLTVERYSHVMHLVSDVKGILSPAARLTDLFNALMPGGSVTGTPKISATRVISEIEPVSRGAYTGSMGYISLNGNMDFNILIRSAFYPENDREVHVYAGSGIVQDSDPQREWKETNEKAKALLESLQGYSSSGYSWEPPRIRSSWDPPKAAPDFRSRHVLMIDNYDSFTYNLVQYVSMLGAKVTVVRNDESDVRNLLKLNPTHLVISPGPGKPDDSGISMEAIRAFEGLPTLGVCLGHQAIVESYGGTVVRGRLPVHGKASEIVRTTHTHPADILSGLPRSFIAGRYHSLVADEVRDPLFVTSETDNGEIMSVQHRDLPIYGVQFHPESVLTKNGLAILENFLRIQGKVKRNDI